MTEASGPHTTHAGYREKVGTFPVFVCVTAVSYLKVIAQNAGADSRACRRNQSPGEFVIVTIST